MASFKELAIVAEVDILTRTSEQDEERRKLFWERVRKREEEFKRKARIHDNFDYEFRYTI